MQPRIDPPRGLIDPRPGDAALQHARYLPPEGLSPYVEHLWWVCWDLRDAAPRMQATLPHPSVHLTFESGGASLVGVMRRRFERKLEGQGEVLGVKFLPGAFSSFIQEDVATLTGHQRPLGALWGAEGTALAREVCLEADLQKRSDRIADFLHARASPPDASQQRARRLVDEIARDPSLTRVESLAARAGVGERTLQRLFRRHVGVSPKWVVHRYRLHEALARIEEGETLCWSAIAQELGFFDQAHFIKVFRSHVGQTPDSYMRRRR